MAYAIVATGGKQVRVEPGQIVEIEKVGDPGEAIVFDDVRMLRRDDGSLAIGTPRVEGARVSGTVLEHGKGKKIIVFKYKPKVNYRRKIGHRQPFARVRIDSIEG